MALPQHSPNAPVDIDRPVAWRICDRCGRRFSLPRTAWQYDWRGNALVNLHLLVCTEECLDIPQPNGQKPIIIGPDPVPVRDPRPGWELQQQQGTGFNGPQTVFPVNTGSNPTRLQALDD